jgi:malto-oligosyltrehalose trehalohydrolase
VVENGDNRASLLDAEQDPPQGKYRAQWNDDYHHAWHVLLTGETQGYYADHSKSPRADIARALASGFVYQGEASTFRKGSPRGEPSGKLAPTAFINFLQNHDQIGNRALSDRLEGLARRDAIEAALAITLLAPAIPMLFMGEEWGSRTPFPFFCDFNGALADAVRRGRRREYAFAYAPPGEESPDPLAPSTFQSAILDWPSCAEQRGRKRLDLVRNLLATRRREIMPRLTGVAFGDAHAADDGALTAHWRMGDGTTLRLIANLTDVAIENKQPPTTGTHLWGREPGEGLPPWSVFWHLETR